MSGNAYDRRRAARQAAREVTLGGETMAAFHRRENAPAPTLAEIFAKNRADTTRCTATPDMFPAKKRRARKSKGRGAQ